MLARLRYLRAEGFEVGHLSSYDAVNGRDELGQASITHVRIAPDGSRRLVSETFEVTAEEAEACSRFFLRSAGGN